MRDGEADVYTDEGGQRRGLRPPTGSDYNIRHKDDLKFTYKPTQEDLMYILWALISDMLWVYEYDTDEFGAMFMGDSCSIEKLRESDVVYNTIKNDIFNLSLNEDILHETMEILREKGIE